jgi:hypothetical protein
MAVSADGWPGGWHLTRPTGPAGHPDRRAAYRQRPGAGRRPWYRW